MSSAILCVAATLLAVIPPFDFASRASVVIAVISALLFLSEKWRTR